MCEERYKTIEVLEQQIDNCKICLEYILYNANKNNNDKKEINNLTINVKNVLGQVVSTKNYSNTTIVSLNIEGINGLYFVEVLKQNGERSVMKVQKN